MSEKNAEELNDWVKGESEIITLENSDHLLSNKTDTEFVTNEIDNWFKTKK